MLNRRTLFKALTAVGLGSVFTSQFGEAALLPPGLRSGRSPGTVQLKQPSVEESEGFNSNLMAIERWEDLLDDVDCVELVTRYEVGCPVCKQQKGPSVTSSPYHFYCDRCQSGGSAIDFYSKIEGVPLAEAALSLEEMLANGELQGCRRVQEHRWEIMAEAERFYHELLLEHPEGAEAKRWLADQGISAGTIEMFGIGYAPIWPSRLLSNHLLLNQGYSFRTLIEALVMCHDDEMVSDRFPGVLIPIRDQKGRCFGFFDRSPSSPCNTAAPGLWIQRTNCTSDRRFRRLVLQAPSWPEDFNKFDEVLITQSPWEVIALHSAGIPNAVYLVGLAPHMMQTARALAMIVIYPWEGGHGSSYTAYSLEAIMREAGPEYQRVKLMVVPAKESLLEMLQQRGAEAVRTAIAEAIPLSQAFTA